MKANPIILDYVDSKPSSEDIVAAIRALESALSQAVRNEFLGYKIMLAQAKKDNPELDVDEAYKEALLGRAKGSRSTWSGGHSTTNMVEQIIREAALDLLR